MRNTFTSEEEFEGNLLEHLAEWVSGGNVSTFEEAGVLSRNHGLVVRLESGEEFQLTVVRSGGGF